MATALSRGYTASIKPLLSVGGFSPSKGLMCSSYTSGGHSGKIRTGRGGSSAPGGSMRGDGGAILGLPDILTRVF